MYLAIYQCRNVFDTSSALQFFQTLNTYSRLYPNKQAEVAQQLENLINGTTVPDTIIKKEKELLRALLIQFCKLEFTLINIFQTLYDYQSGLL